MIKEYFVSKQVFNIDVGKNLSATVGWVNDAEIMHKIKAGISNDVNEINSLSGHSDFFLHYCWKYPILIDIWNFNRDYPLVF